MARFIVAGLMVLNIVLGIGLYLQMGGEKTAKAEIGRPLADVATVTGTANGNTIVYILDVSSGNIAAMQTDVVNNQLKVIDRRNVAADIARIK